MNRDLMSDLLDAGTALAQAAQDALDNAPCLTHADEVELQAAIDAWETVYGRHARSLLTDRAPGQLPLRAVDLPERLRREGF